MENAAATSQMSVSVFKRKERLLMDTNMMKP